MAKENILDFTIAVDKLVVALGDELGDADQITTELGKILNVFDGKVTGDNITKLGNAIVDLANKGVASGGFLVDFTQRVAGIAKTANLTLPAVLGLAAGLEESGAKVESSSTAIQKIIGDMAADLPKAARIAGVSVQDFNQLFSEKPQEALLLYAKGLVGNKASFAEVTASLQDAGEEGARTIAVLATLGQKTDFFRTKMDETGTAIKNTTAIQDAFNLKNEALDAQLDKMGKNLHKWFVNSTLANFFKSLIVDFNNMFGPAKKLTDQFHELDGKINNLERDIVPLANRYDHLKAKTQLSKEEQAEMKSIISQIVAVIPGAVTQFDQYGNAIAISTQRVREFIDAEKARLLVVNQGAIKENESSLKQITQQIADAKRDIDSIAKTGSFNITETASGGTGGASSFTRKANQEEIAAAEEKYRQLLQMKLGYETEIKRLNGQALQEQVDAQQNAAAAAGSGGNAVTDSNVKTLAILKKQLQDLQDAYDKIDITDKRALQKNASERKRLQDQIDNLEGRQTKSQKKDDSEYKRLKKEAEDFAKEIKKLRQDLELNGLTADQQEIVRIHNKYEDLTARAKKYKFDLLQIEGLKQQELDQLFEKQFRKLEEEQQTRDYDNALTSVRDFYEQQRTITAETYSRGLIDKAFYTAEITRLDKEEKQTLIDVSGNYSGRVKKASEDNKNWIKQQEKEITQNAVEETDKRIENAKREELARAQRAVLTSKGKGVDAELAAKKALLQLQFQQETEFLDKKSELYLLKQEELNQQMADMDRQANLQKIDNVMQYVGFFQDALSSLNAIISAKENRQLAEDKKRNDQKRTNYKKQLDNKLISQAQYDLKMAQLNEEQEKKEKEIRRRQAKREKALNLFNAIVNNAAAVLKTMASVPFPVNIPLAIAQGIAGGLQIAAIAKAPLPELGTGDWIRKGPKHKDKEKGIPVLIERDEAVMSAAAMTDNNVYTVSGTPAQITSALNSKNGGANWANGAVIQMAQWRREKPAAINPKMARIMEQGGIVRPIEGVTNTTTNNEETNGLLRQLIQKQEENTEEIKTMKTKLHAVVSIKEYREKEAQYEASKKASGMIQ